MLQTQGMILTPCFPLPFHFHRSKFKNAFKVAICNFDPLLQKTKLNGAC